MKKKMLLALLALTSLSTLTCLGQTTPNANEVRLKLIENLKEAVITIEYQKCDQVRKEKEDPETGFVTYYYVLECGENVTEKYKLPVIFDSLSREYYTWNDKTARFERGSSYNYWDIQIYKQEVDGKIVSGYPHGFTFTKCTGTASYPSYGCAKYYSLLIDVPDYYTKKYDKKNFSQSLIFDIANAQKGQELDLLAIMKAKKGKVLPSIVLKFNILSELSVTKKGMEISNVPLKKLTIKIKE